MTVTPLRAGAEPGILPELIQAPAFTGPHVLLADVSEFQPNIADAAYLAWSKAIVIRCAYGDAHDDKAWYGGQRRDQLHAGGAKFVGIYQYLVGSQSGAAQAQAFHSLVGAIRPGEVFIADFEEGAASVLHAWYGEMTALYGTIIRPHLWTYSGLSFGQAQGVLPVEWIAAYRSAEPSSPHRLWQFTDRYSVPGVGSCDCSVFHGTADQLAALAYQHAAPAPPPPAVLPAPATVSVTPHKVINASWSPVEHDGQPVNRYRVEIAKGTPDKPAAPFFSQLVDGTHLMGQAVPDGPLVMHVKAAADGIDGHYSPWKAIA